MDQENIIDQEYINDQRKWKKTKEISKKCDSLDSNLQFVQFFSLLFFLTFVIIFTVKYKVQYDKIEELSIQVKESNDTPSGNSDDFNIDEVLKIINSQTEYLNNEQKKANGLTTTINNYIKDIDTMGQNLKTHQNAFTKNQIVDTRLLQSQLDFVQDSKDKLKKSIASLDSYFANKTSPFEIFAINNNASYLISELTKPIEICKSFIKMLDNSSGLAAASIKMTNDKKYFFCN